MPRLPTVRGNVPTSESQMQPATPSRPSSSNAPTKRRPTTEPYMSTKDYTLQRDLEYQAWFADSGASHHLTCLASCIQNKFPYVGSDRVQIGNNQSLHIQSVWSSWFVPQTSPHTPLVLKLILHVPEITRNLMPVSKFAKYNFVIFELCANKCLVKSQVSNRVVLEGNLVENGLYCFPHIRLVQLQAYGIVALPSHSGISSPRSMIDSGQKTTKVNCMSYDALSLWHYRLGNVNFLTVRHVLSLCDIKVHNKIASKKCSSCCLGKSHRLHAPHALTVYESPFDLVYADLWGPAPFVSNFGFNYYISFVDACTKFTWLYLLKQKFDVITTFNIFHAYVKT